MLFLPGNLLGSLTSVASVLASAAYSFQSFHRFQAQDNIPISNGGTP